LELSSGDLYIEGRFLTTNLLPIVPLKALAILLELAVLVVELSTEQEVQQTV
jgi:hypothetical protein